MSWSLASPKVLRLSMSPCLMWTCCAAHMHQHQALAFCAPIISFCWCRCCLGDGQHALPSPG